MGKGSKIAWTDHTFNIVHGCEEVSPGCDHCYARELDGRYHGDNGHWGDKPRRIMSDKYWNEPRKWNRDAQAAGKPALVFCSSMADVFENHPTVASQRDRLWPLIRETLWLRWLLLTKRASNAKRMLPKDLWGAPNIWLGTTVESPAYLWRAKAICEVPAPVHFLSMEPLIEQVDLREISSNLDRTNINWIIDGCESGNHARPTPIDWYRQHRDVCEMYEVDYFFKQAPRGVPGIALGDGAWLKMNVPTAHPDTGERMVGIIEQPYLDGRQHIARPAA